MLSLLGEYKKRMAAIRDSAPPGIDLTDYIGVPSLRSRRASTAALAAIEARLPVPLPVSFRMYLLGPLVETGIEWAQVQLPGNDRNDLAQSFLFLTHLWPVQLLQFATQEGDPVCFDFRQPIQTDPLEYQVVIIAHDWLTPADSTDPTRIRRFISATFTDLGALLDALCLDKPIEHRRVGSA